MGYCTIVVGASCTLGTGLTCLRLPGWSVTMSSLPAMSALRPWCVQNVNRNSRTNGYQQFLTRLVFSWQVCQRTPSGTLQPILPSSRLVLFWPFGLVLRLRQLRGQPGALQGEEPRPQGQVQRGGNAQAWLWWRWERRWWWLHLWARLDDCNNTMYVKPVNNWCTWALSVISNIYSFFAWVASALSFRLLFLQFFTISGAFWGPNRTSFRGQNRSEQCPAEKPAWWPPASAEEASPPAPPTRLPQARPSRPGWASPRSRRRPLGTAPCYRKTSMCTNWWRTWWSPASGRRTRPTRSFRWSWRGTILPWSEYA